MNYFCCSWFINTCSWFYLESWSFKHLLDALGSDQAGRYASDGQPLAIFSQNLETEYSRTVTLKSGGMICFWASLLKHRFMKAFLRCWTRALVHIWAPFNQYCVLLSESLSANKRPFQLWASKVHCVPFAYNAVLQETYNIQSPVQELATLQFLPHSSSALWLWEFYLLLLNCLILKCF